MSRKQPHQQGIELSYLVNMESSIPTGGFVKKLRYTDDELRENPNASDKTLNQNQGDGMNVRVWWDTNRYQ